MPRSFDERPFRERRAQFDALAAELGRSTCPCCGYPTLRERGGFEMCAICWWEDDGQDDSDAANIRGGPNGNYSLAQARANAADHFTMYDPGRDTRIDGPDSEAEVQAKRALIAAYDVLRGAAPEARASVWRDVRRLEGVLSLEQRGQIDGR